jgi:hypothetical protein
MRGIARAALASIALASVSVCNAGSDSQERGKHLNAINARLSSALLSNSTVPDLLTYSQNYIDDDDEVVKYNGTFFLSLSSISVDESCLLHIDIRGQDRYEGLVRHHSRFRGKLQLESVKPTVESMEYLITLSLRPEVALQWGTKHAPPVRLENAYTQCVDHKDCSLDWLSIYSDRKSLHMLYLEDSFLTHDTDVSAADIPAAPTLQMEVINDLRDARQACRM